MTLPNSSKSWVLITGASSGIGEAFAKRFAREEWNTVLVARSLDKLETLAEILRKENNSETVVLREDLSDSKAPRRIYEEIRRRKILLEGLINNAGIGVRGKFAEAPLDQFLKMIDINARALVELTGLFLPEMISRKHGFIINVSSTSSFLPLPYQALYAATKALVSSFSESLWSETRGTGVRILNLCPGLTKTNFGTAAGMRDFREDPIAEQPVAVVDTAFKALRRNQPSVISGWYNRLIPFFTKLIPHRLMLIAIPWIQKMRGLA
ncbi:MAG: SDR family oxidoreductase [Candidatus Omnitrophica bacterium]|nr:SDR family oxidoreductase [Candidatus Omnitrophota bacterium]